MTELLIKIRLVPSCDNEILQHFELVPKGRRAEEARKLILLAIQGNHHIKPNQKPAKESIMEVSTDGISDDEQFFANDFNEIGIN